MSVQADTFAHPFHLHDAPDGESLDIRFDESLMQHAISSGPSACVWQAPQALVVPRTYLRSAVFDDVCRQFQSQGWPVLVRHSGGGVVPQGPGILNVSLTYAVEGRPLDHSDTAYQLLCELISETVAPLGISAHTRAVDGSFCDGRLNRAVDRDATPRQSRGAAQRWTLVPH